MGTVFSLAVPEQADADLLAAAWSDACGLLRRIEEIYSPFIADSPVSRIRDGRLSPADLDTQADLSPAEAADFREVLGLCAQLRAETFGAFDAWAVGERPNFDPCGAVKGWAAERASRLLAERGLPEHLLNAGGDVRLRSTGTEWNVGVEDPHRPDRILVRLRRTEGAVATSGTRQRGAHVWDPRRRRPAAGLVQASVTGPDLALADGYATAAIALGGEARPFLARLAESHGYESITVDEDTGVWWTPGLERYAPELREVRNRAERPGKADFLGTFAHPQE
jgi:thiamine biosynthesis lipoprotein